LEELEMPYSFGKTSQSNIAALHPDLKATITEALATSPVDYGVLNLGGARTAAEQHELWMKGRGYPGKIVTDKDGIKNKSNHQLKDDGFGYAVDVVPYVSGSFTWNWEHFYPMIKSVALVARKRGTSLRWGGVWDRKLEELNADDLEGEVRAYCLRHPGPDHIDGPHLEYLGKIAATPKTSVKK
jgi:peptidoglycan L-alanyl-D-glutamate endopeptidase CwlK